MLWRCQNTALRAPSAAIWRCQNTAHFYWCLHTFVKYVECMQHFHEWVWLDRDLGGTSESAESKDVRNDYTLYILAACGALTLSKYCPQSTKRSNLTLSKYCPFLLVFAHLCKICRVHAALSWVSMIRSGFGAHLNVQNRKMYAMVTLCTF